MEGFSVSSDQWHLVARHLSIVDLCRLMQVSREWFHLWIADRAWSYHRQRICSQFPELNALFELYCDQGASGEHSSKRTQKSNSNKERKKVWITPKRGVWYIFKKWLMMGTNMQGFETLLKRKDMHPLAMSVIKMCLPFQERITKLYAEYSNHYIVWIEWDTNCRFSVETSKTNSFFRMVLHISDNRFYLQKDYVTREVFSSWKRYLLQTTHCVYGLMFLADVLRLLFSKKH